MSANGEMSVKRPLPPLRSDEEAEDFVANADLTEYDLSGFRPSRLRFVPPKGVEECGPAAVPAGAIPRFFGEGAVTPGVK